MDLSGESPQIEMHTVKMEFIDVAVSFAGGAISALVELKSLNVWGFAPDILP